MAHTHKHEKRVWLPDAHTVKAIEHSTDHLRTSDEEFERALRILRQYPMRVTIFGSARTPIGDPYYKLARKVAKHLANKGFAIISGGGHGIMEAANRGAYEAGGDAVGFNIILPHEQKLNKYTTRHLAFHYFFTRKVMMTFYAHGFIYFPGGFGTFDELFEVITLIQTKKMPRVPVILVGSAYWRSVDLFIKRHMLEMGYIDEADREIYTIVDDAEEICQIINADYNT